MNTMSITLSNYSLIENAFVDDSADISSDETLFSISPSAYDINDTGEQTPLPTITSPLYDYHSSLIDNDFKPSYFDNKNNKSLIESNSEISDSSFTMNNSKKSKSLKSNREKRVAFFNIDYEKEIEPIKQPTRVEEKIIINQIVPCLCGQPQTHPLLEEEQKQNQIISNKIETTTTTNNNNNNIINNYNYNYNQTSTTIDMKSQMVKYNEYLHYLRFGFPKKNKF